MLEEDEQTLALTEVRRVLRHGGFGLIEGPLYEEATSAEINTGRRRGPDGRIVWTEVEGMLNPHYARDERSFHRVCSVAGIECCQVFERDWAGRERLFLRIEKRD